MNGVGLALLTAVLGVDVGWQPLPNGGLEYIIQIEPQLLDSIRAGNDLVSDIPANLQGVRSYRITIGSDRLPRIGEPAEVGGPDAAAGPGSSIDDLAGAEPDSTTTYLPQGTIAGGDTEFRLRVVAAKLPAGAEQMPETGPLADGPLLFAPTTPDESHQADTQAAAADERAADVARPADERPWTLLALAVLGLFLSLGFNLFLGWATWGFRQRYESLAARLAGAQPQAS